MPNGVRPNHGGYRRPSQPAASSGPGSQSQRTDGRYQPGQLLAQTPAGTYGDKAALQAVQSTVPAPQGQPLRTATPQPQQPQGDPQQVQQYLASLGQGVFAPTQRPGEPLTAGAALGAGSTPILGDDPLAVLRAAASQFPLPGVIALLRRHGG